MVIVCHTMQRDSSLTKSPWSTVPAVFFMLPEHQWGRLTVLEQCDSHIMRQKENC